jgi:hypothetical protein
VGLDFPLVGGVCERRDSNPHVRGHRDLNPARLPVPPRSRAAVRAYNSVPRGPVPRRGWRDERSGVRTVLPGRRFSSGGPAVNLQTGAPQWQGATRQRRRRNRTSDTTPATIARKTATIKTITTKTQIHSGPGIARLLRLVAVGALGSNLPSGLIRAASFYPATGSDNRARLLTGARPGCITRPAAGGLVRPSEPARQRFHQTPPGAPPIPARFLASSGGRGDGHRGAGDRHRRLPHLPPVGAIVVLVLANNAGGRPEHLGVGGSPELT